MVAKYLGALAAVALAASPVAAAPVANLSIAKSARVGSNAKKGNDLAGGGFVIAIIAVVAVIAGVVIVANSDDSDSN